MSERRLFNFFAAAVCAGMLAYALYSQFARGFEPCPLCIFQRIAIAALGLIFLLAALHHPRGWGQAVYSLLIALSGGAAAYVSGRHVWIQAQPPGTVPLCGAPLDTMLEFLPLTEVIRKVLTGGGECGKIDWSLLGVSMPGWVLICAVALTLFGQVNNRRSRR
jgi:disulfide bond formation protein DsbB